MVTDPFLPEALRIGRDVAGGALRSGGEATWLADDFALAGGQWQATAGTLGPELGTGTAGVGWLLARLATLAGDRELAAVAAAALRHAAARAEALARAGRLDWYGGATGVAWAALDGGRALADASLAAAGEHAAAIAVRAAGERVEDERAAAERTSAERAAAERAFGTSRDVSGPTAPAGQPSSVFGLADGTSGDVVGLLALAATGAVDGAAGAALASARRLADTIAAEAAAPAGLARGLSGAGLALAATAAATGDAGCRAAAAQAFAAERAHFEPGHGWLAPPAHPWLGGPPASDASWCRGAAGIGLARLAGWRALGDELLLAEAGAAVELVRAALSGPGAADDSLCHGSTGAIELLVAAGALLDEPAHAHAARAAGLAMIERAWARGRYTAGVGPRARNPSLLLGLAGTVALLLRLHDPGAIPSPALPPS